MRTWGGVGVAALLALGGSACIEREGRPVSPCTNVTLEQYVRIDRVDRVDLLFMVDNSNSMAEEQASLVAEIPRMVRVLASGDFDQDGALDGPEDFEAVRDLHVGVITSDMGTGGFTVPTCGQSDFGDDGLLRTRGRTDLGCISSYPGFLSFRPRDGGDPDRFARDVTCVAAAGTGGCGFEQQLEAILKAGSPTSVTGWTSPEYAPPTFFRNTYGHGDTDNNGFFRDNAVLAVIPLTDEDDCSALDPELFNPSSARYASDLNLRCFAHPEAVHPIARYVDGFLQLRPREGMLLYAPITGVPVDLAPGFGERPDFDAILTDPRMEERLDPSRENRLVPSCDVPGRGVAFPPRRMVEVGRELEARGAGVTVQSICNDTFTGALSEILRLLKSRLAADCLPRRLNPSEDGTVDCAITAVLPSGVECADQPGASPRLGDGGPLRENDRAVCTIEQLVASAEDRAMRRLPEAPGWLYDDYTLEAEAGCGRDPYQRIAFTRLLPGGTEVRFECFSAVEDPGAFVGTFCDPDGEPVCAGRALPLVCDRVSRSCEVPCTDDAACRSAGLVGFECDTRPLDGTETPRGVCVNPTCS